MTITTVYTNDLTDPANGGAGDVALKNIEDFTRWEIDSGRIADGGGSPWWKTVNGHMIADMEDAMKIVDSGGSTSDEVAVQLWIDLYTFKDYGDEAYSDYHSILFWSAHQASLHEGIDLAAPLRRGETSLENEFIDVVIGNVDWTADQSFNPNTLAGNGVGLYINNVLNYPQYPNTNDASDYRVQSYVDAVAATGESVVGGLWHWISSGGLHA